MNIDSPDYSKQQPYTGVISNNNYNIIDNYLFLITVNSSPEVVFYSANGKLVGVARACAAKLW